MAIKIINTKNADKNETEPKIKSPNLNLLFLLTEAVLSPHPIFFLIDAAFRPIPSYIIF